MVVLDLTKHEGKIYLNVNYSSEEIERDRLEQERNLDKILEKTLIMRKELKLFYKVISFETLIWIILFIGFFYFI